MKTIRHERFDCDHLDAADYRRLRFTYYVTGRGEFPFDMLRYDCCWPATGEDAVKLADTFRFDGNWSKHCSIKLISYREPTIERWSSFAWSVGKEALIK